MLRRKRVLPGRALFLLALAALVVLLPAASRPAVAQAVVTGPIQPLNGTTVNGSMNVTSGDQGAAIVGVQLSGLVPRTVVDVNVYLGTCSQPGSRVAGLYTLGANDAGQAAGQAPVFRTDGSAVAFAELTNGNHILLVVSSGRAVGCGPVPPAGSPAGLAAALLAEGERQQVMQFNPNAALQKQIFAHGFVPNSAEFSTVIEATSFAVQRAEHMGTGAVRAYFARTGDWGNVRYAQRGVSTDPLGLYMLAEAEKHQAIRFNPNAALQKRIFADGFVPNSPEFQLLYAGVNYTGQRAEHLGSGRVRVYFAITGQWYDVRYVQRGGGAPQPTPLPGPAVSISPTSGPPWTVVRVTGTNFGRQVGVALWGGQVGWPLTQLSSGMTDGNGQAVFDVPVQGAPGQRWVFSIVSGQQHAESQEFQVTG